MDFSRNIEAARRRKGWSQAFLAQTIGVDQGRVSRWERNEGLPTLPQIVAISHATGASLEELLLGAEPQPAGVVLSEDEQMIVTLLRALQLDRDDVLRAVSEVSARKAHGKPAGESVTIAHFDRTAFDEELVRQYRQKERDEARAKAKAEREEKTKKKDITK